MHSPRSQGGTGQRSWPSETDPPPLPVMDHSGNSTPWRCEMPWAEGSASSPRERTNGDKADCGVLAPQGGFRAKPPVHLFIHSFNNYLLKASLGVTFQ